ncbi:hypothetical protein B0H17DRAFT_1126519 [Mycena rosella]|uniref:Uncharacterized protein n=1 Tax=Mycena rosella TaxID=1033263 RepID=A0AAD7GTL5_MYCRO|nr:hypothetical protein B0H17DRAFT_1126519 [Mycena rosella]
MGCCAKHLFTAERSLANQDSVHYLQWQWRHGGSGRGGIGGGEILQIVAISATWWLICSVLTYGSTRQKSPRMAVGATGAYFWRLEPYVSALQISHEVVLMAAAQTL